MRTVILVRESGDTRCWPGDLLGEGKERLWHLPLLKLGRRLDSGGRYRGFLGTYLPSSIIKFVPLFNPAQNLIEREIVSVERFQIWYPVQSRVRCQDAACGQSLPLPLSKKPPGRAPDDFSRR
jgi:hypothetical protein